MKLHLIFGLICILSLELKGQSEFVISGSIVDSLGNPIPFSVIALEDHSQGTYCDINGHFILKVERLPVSLEITSIGYEKKRLRVATSHSKEISIELRQEVIKLNEVVVTDAKVKPKTIGSSKAGKGAIAFGVNNPFEQLGLVINNEDNQLYRDPIWLSFSVRIPRWSFFGMQIGVKPTGEKQLRLRIYRINNKTEVGEDILHENIFLSPKKGGWYTVDIRDQHLLLPQEGFMVAVEWLGNQSTYKWESEKKLIWEQYGIGIVGHRLSTEEKKYYSTLRFRSFTKGWQKPEHIAERELHIPCFRLEFIKMDEVAR